MRRLTHLLLSPRSRFARLLIGEKRLTYDSVTPEDSRRICPCSSIWTARAAKGCGPSSTISKAPIPTTR